MAQQTSIGGVFEAGIGASDERPLIAYFERFGFRVGATGELDEDAAHELYGVRSRLRSFRLEHLDADHGLIRIMVWEKPVNDGLGMSRMNVLGNRWGAMMTSDILNIQNHAEEAIAQKLPVFMVEPQRAEIYKLEKRPEPFLENYATVREMCLIKPLTRQIFFQRFGYSLKNYGKTDDRSFFKSSQITHFGMVVYLNRDNLEFYDKILGLLRVKDARGFDSNYENPSSRAIFSLEKHQMYGATDFDDPRSSTNPAEARSGRLKVIWFSEDSKLENRMDRSRPGSLGFSLYTYRVTGVEAFREKIIKSKATRITALAQNEFGESSFSFRAPDGYDWTFIGK
jgi:uncharacterized glyoxalase superfamily protein PhnB